MSRDDLIFVLDNVLSKTKGEVTGVYLSLAMKDSDIEGTTQFFHGVAGMDATQQVNVGNIIMQKAKEEALNIGWRKTLDEMFAEKSDNPDAQEIRATISELESSESTNVDIEFGKRKVALMRKCWEENKPQSEFITLARELQKELWEVFGKTESN